MSEPSSKSKSELRAERRALQEAQRAAKQAAKDSSGKPSANKQEAKKLSKPKGSESKTTLENVLTAASPSLDHPCTDPSVNPATNSHSCIPSVAATYNADSSMVKLQGPFPCVPTRKQEPNRVHLFKHLKEPDRRIDVVQNLGLGPCSPIHPSFIALGINLDEGRIWGSNEIALHFLMACESLIRAHQPAVAAQGQHSCSFARQFEPILQRQFHFLVNCRSPTVTMHSSYQYLKQVLNQLDSLENWEKCRSRLLSSVDEFRQQSIYLAGAEIAERASSYIQPGDCICTFGYSSVVARVLLRAWFGDAPLPGSRDAVIEDDHDSNHDRIISPRPARTESSLRPHRSVVPFSVLVVDSRPKFQGRRMLSHLVRAGIPCEYTHIAALPGLAHKISLTIVGADALLNNGYVLAGIGTAQVANIVWNVSRSPVLVCAETYKFWERAHSNSFEFNELGDPDDVWRGPLNPEHVDSRLPLSSLATDLSDWRSNPRLRLLQLTYDVLPPALVSAVITEKGTLPTTSVPVVLRVKQASVPL